MFVIVVPVSLSATTIALLSEPDSVEKIFPLFTIVVLSAPVPASPRIVFPSDEITPPLLFVMDTPSDLLTLIAFDVSALIVPEFVIVKSAPSVNIVLLLVVVVIVDPEWIVSETPVLSASLLIKSFRLRVNVLLFVITALLSSTVKIYCVSDESDE